MKHTPEEQCMLDMMEIAGFPLEIVHGLYTMKFEDWTKRYAPTRQGNVSTADFNRVIKVFEFWKEQRNEN